MLLEVDIIKSIWTFLSNNGVSLILLFSNLLTYKLAVRDRKAKVEKTEGEVQKDKVDVQIKVDQYNDKKWERMQKENGTLNVEIRRIRTQLYAADEKHREEFNDMAHKLHQAEILNIELTAEANFYRTITNRKYKN